MRQIKISEFKAVCLRLLEEILQTGQPVKILKNGKPLAVVHPVHSASGKAVFEAMKKTLTAPVEDLVTPLDETEWEVLRR